MKIYVDGKPIETDRRRREFERRYLCCASGLSLLGSGLSFAVLDELSIYDECLGEDAIAFLSSARPEEILARAEKLNPTQKTFLENTYFNEHDKDRPKLVAAVKQAEGKLAAFEKRAITQVSVMQEMPEPRQTYLLVRGELHSAGYQ